MSTGSATDLPAYLTRLDDKQRAAALDTEGYVVIDACAGAGKTAVLAARVAYLLESGVPPERMLCLTFTNKAADEMRSRIETYCGRDLSPMWIGTYHSICSRILRAVGREIGLRPDFSIVDDAHSSHLITQIIGESGRLKSTKPSEAKTWIDRMKSELGEQDELSSSSPHNTGHVSTRTLYQIYWTYQERLRKMNALDFGDLTRETANLLRSYPDARHRLSSMFRYVLCDEYQDSSPVEAEVARLLSSRHGNLCVVGDIRQSIYSFKGSDYRLMATFERKHPGARQHVLSTNYRSATRIVHAAGKLVSGSAVHPGYRCTTNRTEVGEVLLARFETDAEEAETVARSIEEIVATQMASYSDIAVLSRVRHITKRLEEALQNQGVPFTPHDGLKWLQSLEVQCALAYLRLSVNGDDQYGQEHLVRIVGHVPETVNRFTAMYACGVRLQQLLASVVRQVEMDLGPSASKYLGELLATADGYKGRIGTTLPALLDSLANVAEPDDAVRLMTIHQSKGLEFRVVFVLGMDEGILPYWRSLDDAIDEELRLCYVALTRARERLCLCCSHSRCLNGRSVHFDRSRFLDKLPLTPTCQHSHRTSQLGSPRLPPGHWRKAGV